MTLEKQYNTESENLYDQILHLSEEYFMRYIGDPCNYDNADKYFEPCSLDDSDEIICERIKPLLLRKEIWKLYSLFRKLIDQSQIDQFYWRYCPLSVYKYHLAERVKEYKSEHFDSNNRDFFIVELIDICRPEENQRRDMKSLKYDFDNFNILPTQIIIDNEILPETQFDFNGESVFQDFNETVQKRKIEYILELLKNDGTENLPVFEKRENKSFEIFKNDGYQFFLYINDNYTRDDNSPRAKYSNIFRYLDHKDKIIGTQDQYMKFIKSEFDIKMSKILPENKIKYPDQILPILNRCRSNFYAQNRIE